VAKSDRATVFLWGETVWKLKHNNAYVDDVRLYTTDPPSGTLTEARVREIVREELVAAG